jgi:hypothetical protein
VDALLALFHHDPDTAPDLARAGAFLVAEFFFVFRGLARLLGSLFGRRKKR